MYTEEFCTKLQSALENEEVVSRLASAKDDESLKSIFLELGFEIADEELAEIYSQLEEYKNCDELTEEMLDAVNGGCMICFAVGVGAAVVTAIVVWKVGTWIVDRKYGK